MGIASVIAAIVLAGVVFMLRFLLALLREGTPSVSYRIVPLRQKSDRENLVAAEWRSQRENEKEKESRRDLPKPGAHGAIIGLYRVLPPAGFSRG